MMRDMTIRVITDKIHPAMPPYMLKENCAQVPSSGTLISKGRGFGRFKSEKDATTTAGTRGPSATCTTGTCSSGRGPASEDVARIPGVLTIGHGFGASQAG